MYLWYEINVF